MNDAGYGDADFEVHMGDAGGDVHCLLPESEARLEI